MAQTLFGTDSDDLLINVYQQQGRTLDDLPYTDEFEAIYQTVVSEERSPAGDDDAPTMSRAELFHRLHNLRKAGRLPRLGRAASSPPRLDDEQEQMLIQLVEAAIGKLSLRDQLLYTQTFDDIVIGFNGRTGMNLSPHDAWRVVAKLAK